MLAFGLGTLPVMLGADSVAAWLTPKLRDPRWRTGAGFMVIALALSGMRRIAGSGPGLAEAFRICLPAALGAREYGVALRQPAGIPPQAECSIARFTSAQMARRGACASMANRVRFVAPGAKQWHARFWTTVSTTGKRSVQPGVAGIAGSIDSTLQEALARASRIDAAAPVSAIPPGQQAH